MPDFEADKAPDYEPPDGAKAQDAIGGDHPFIMQADGRGMALRPAGLDGRPAARRTTSRTSRRSDNPLYAQQREPARQQ